jgi:hypothetical protein
MVGRIDDINFHMLEDEILTVAVAELDNLTNLSTSLQWREEW